MPPRAMASMQVSKTAISAGVSAASAVVGEISKSVAKDGVEAPEAKSSFVAMDADRAGLVDENGLPLVYNKDAIQKYWEGQGSALQQRWLEFLGETVPFLTKVAGYLISGGTDGLTANAAELARDARISIEKLGPTYVKMGQMMSVRPDVRPQVRSPPGAPPRRASTVRLGVRGDTSAFR